jgi:NADH-quinone oxidoreductase subunit J
MMLDIDFAALRGELARYLPLALLMGVVVLAMLGIAFGNWQSSVGESALAVPIVENSLNTHALGMVLYDRYLLPFQLAGLILLVAMIGAILLTLRHRRDIKRQDVLQQMWRDPAKAMRMTNPKSGQGL